MHHFGGSLMKKIILFVIKKISKFFSNVENKLSEDNKLSALEKQYKIALLKTEAQLIKETIYSVFFSYSPNQLTIEKASVLLEHLENSYYPFLGELKEYHLTRILGSIVSIHNSKFSVVSNFDPIEKELFLSIIRALDSLQNNSLLKYSDDTLYEKLFSTETYRKKI